MLRDFKAVMMAMMMAPLLLSHAHAEGDIPGPRWGAVTAAPNSLRSGSPEIIPVQEPFCEYGVGPCGGTCSEEGGKRWACASNELPCYQLGRCKCEAASACKAAPAPNPKKKKSPAGDKTDGQ